MLGRKKKVQDCDYAFGSSTKFQRRMNGFVKADICRQVSVCLHVFCGILFALKPFCDYSLCSVCILPQPAFYSQSVVCILPLVRSPQSAVFVYPDRIFFGFATFQIRYVRVRQLKTGLAAFWRSPKLASLEEKA